MPKERCDHSIWIYESKSCCYRLHCKYCSRGTTAYHIKGRMPKVGEEVKLVDETIEVLKR
jgi:hypothetical protein